jgi:ATP/maltotriose-dependent transcriptional regulator MalT
MVKPSRIPPAAEFVERKRLFQRLSRSSAKRATCIVAAPGYGKTVLLASYLRHTAQPFVWLELSVAEQDVTGFVASVVEAFTGGDATLDSGAPTLRLAEPHRWKPVLMNLLHRLRDAARPPHVLVLDNFERVTDSPRVLECLDLLVQGLPSWAHCFIVSSRSLASAGLVRLRQYGELELLQEEDLAFNLAETAALVRAWGITADEQLVADVHRATGGWPAVFPFLRSRLQDSVTDVGTLLNGGVQTAAAAAYEFFAQCVVESIDSDLQDFLIETSILDRFDAQLCATVTANPEAEALLVRARERHFYVQSFEDGSSFAYHSLFRAFLERRLMERRSAAAIRTLHQRAARAYRNRRDMDRAIQHFMDGEEWSDVVAIIKSHGPSLASAGKLDTLSRWLGMVPDDILNADGTLLLLKGRTLRIQGLSAAAMQPLRQSYEILAAGGDLRQAAESACELGTAHYYVGQPRRGIDWLQRARALNVDSGPEIEARIASGLVAAYGRIYELRQAVVEGERALDAIRHISASPSRLGIELATYRRLAVAQFRHGHANRAYTWLTKALQLHETEHVDAVNRARNWYVLAALRRAQGRMDDALNGIVAARDLLQDQDAPGLLAKVEAVYGELLVLVGRVDEAEPFYRRAGYPARDESDTAYLRFGQGHLAQARALVAEHLNTVDVSEQRSVYGRLLAFRGLIEKCSGELAQSEADLRAALEIFAADSALARVAGAQLHLAHVRWQLGDVTEAVALLDQALGFVAHERYYHFFLWHADTVVSMAALAVSRSLHVEFVRTLCQLRLGCDPPALAIPPSVLNSCQDPAVRRRLLAAIGEQWISPTGLLTLRDGCGLSWRELDVFVRYYLLPSAPVSAKVERSWRSDVAQQLSVSDSTVRAHVTQIRRKLGLSGRKTGSSVLQWAITRGVAGSRLFSDSSTSSE